MMRTHSLHFAVGTRVVRRNVRGFVQGFSKETGVKDLRVSWDDGTFSDIPNPRYKWVNYIWAEDPDACSAVLCHSAAACRLTSGVTGVTLAP